MDRLLSLNQAVIGARRFPAGVSREQTLAAGEVAILLVFGALSGVLLALAPQGIPIPGQAILRVLLPLAAGIALAPRHSSGTIMSSVGSVTALALFMGHVGRVQPAALASLLALGPLLDLVLSRDLSGWRLYAGLILAGVGANLIAFGVRFLTAGAGIDAPGAHRATSAWPMTLASFAACGLVAGLVSAAICFRFRAYPRAARERRFVENESLARRSDEPY